MDRQLVREDEYASTQRKLEEQDFLSADGAQQSSHVYEEDNS